MSETKTEKAVCGKCSADVRDGMAFCYSCGSKIEALPARVDSNDAAAAIPKPDVNVPLEPMIVKEPSDDGKLSRAADERRKSRSGLRRSKEYTWEPSEDSRFSIIASVVIAVIAFVVVFVTVLWK